MLYAAGEYACTEFIKEIITADLEVSFSVNSSYSAAAAVNLYFTEVQAPGRTVKVSLIKNGDGSASVSLNDGEAVQLYTSSAKTAKLAFAGITHNMGINNGVLSFDQLRLPLTAWLGGEKYGGFDKCLAGLKIEFVRSQSSQLNIKLNMISLNQQTLTSSPEDHQGPKISLESLKGWQFGQNTVVDFPALYARDVLDAYCSPLLLTITLPDEKGFMTAEDGTVLNSADASKGYKIKLDVLGAYVVNVVCSDSANKAERSFTIKCNDVTPPEITLSKYTEQAKAGQRITLPQAYAADANTLQPVIYYYIFAPGGTLITEESGGGFTVKKAGKYCVRYIAYDASNNFSVKEFTVYVS